MADTIGIADPRDTDHRYRNIMRRHYLFPLQLLILLFMLGVGAPAYALTDQTITFGSSPELGVGGTGAVSATADSGLAVTFTSTDTNICTISGSTVTGVAAGTCTIAADQFGDATYAAATQVTQNITIGNTSQTITFGTAPSLGVGGTGTVSATTNPGNLSITAFSSTNQSVCTVSGNTVTALTMGTCTIAANHAGNATYAKATPATQNITVIKGSQTITFGSVPTVVVGDTGTVTATGGASGNPVTFTVPITTSVCTISGSTVTGVTAGTCTIAANQATNASYNAATQVTQDITVDKGSQTITFGSAPTLVVGGTGTVTATGGASGNPVTFTVPITTSVCTISGSTVTALTAGTCTIAANQATNANYNAATQATQDITVGKASQTITFGSAPTVVVEGTGSVSATATSGLTVTFTVPTTTSICTISGSSITGVAAGKCTIAANQAGNANYAAAPQKTQDITIGKGSQTITFGAQAGKVFDTAPFTLASPATATSGLAVSYAAAPASVCKINSTTVTMVAAGTCTITASQSGNSNYNAASAVAQPIIISQASQTITFGPQAAKNFGAPPFLLNPLATATSGLAVTYFSITSPVCSINGSTVTIIAIGTCIIAANQVGNATYGTAAQVTQSIVISKGSQSITFGAQTGKAFGAAPFKLSPLATADSKLEVAYTSQTPSVCTISGSTVTIVSAGACTIAADQAGDSNYNAATRVTRDITISKGTQKITFGTQTSKAFSTTPFTLSPLATTDSGLAVTYTSTTPLICSISGSAVTMVMPGTCTIAANQAGDGNYSAAPQITQSIIFSKGTQTITFGVQSPQIIGVAPFALNPVATANSGLEVSYSASPTTTCTISGTTVTALAIGTCTISVSQAGDSYYSAATAVTQGIVIAKTTAPGVPTLTGVTAGYGSATLSFDAPASNGGSKITAYNAACAATGETTRTGTGAASSIIVQGLTIGVTYSCSVAATNSVGTSAASLGLPVTPIASYVVPTTTSNPLTSMWWNEQEPGWGMSITQHGAMVFMGWYAYDASGVPTWYVISSCPMLGNACTGEIYAVSGGDSFVTPWDGSAKIVTKVGIGILTFTNANTGTFNFTINGQPGFKFITRQIFASGFTTPNPDYSDLWWNPSESGWGVVLTQQYGIIFAVLFGYDETGNPTWYVASDCRVDGNYCSGSLYQVKGGTVPTTTWDGTNLVVTTVGFIEFVFGDASNGTMNYFINGVAGTKVITRQSF